MGVNPLALLEGTMTVEGVGVPSLWGYNDYNEELHHRLIDTQWELQSLQVRAKEEMNKKEEHIQKLLLLLKATSQERDEAREQLQLLLSNVRLPITLAAALEPCSPHQAWQTKGSNNSSSTDSDGQSYVSSPVKSLFDANASPELPNTNTSVAVGIPKYDQASARLEQLASRRPLPEKGKLMDAVIKVGPLLQSLLVAGPLPRWKNPPSLQQLHIPPVSVKPRSSQSPNPFAQNACSGFHNETLMNGTAMKRTVMISPCSGSFGCLPGKRLKSQ